MVKTLRELLAALGAAYNITGEDRYVFKASELLSAFFLDAKTPMNPNLNYAPAVPGVSPGRGIGVIDALHLIEIPAAVLAIEKSKSFPPEVQRNIGITQPVLWVKELRPFQTPPASSAKNGE